MSAEFIYLIPVVISIFLAFNMGGSGTSPSFAAAYGADLIRKEYIPGLFGIFVMLGAVIAGGKVVKTIGGSVLPAENMDLILVSIILLSSALSIFFANMARVPQSTSQSTIFALAGCAMYLGALQTDKLFVEIIPAWFILPVICFFITLGCGFMLRKLIINRVIPDLRNYSNHPAWTMITLFCSCYVAFSIGANNVANAAGPVASMLINEMNASPEHSLLISLICVLLIAPWFGIGSSMIGGRVLQTTGKEIVTMSPMEASLIAFITATLLLLASITRGIPASLVQMNTFAIIALNIIKKKKRQRDSRRVQMKLYITWFMAPIAAFIIALLLMLVADHANLITAALSS